MRKYWAMRKTDVQILKILREEHLDLTKYGLRYAAKVTICLCLPDRSLISINTFREMRKEMGLERARTQKHTVESIHEFVSELRVLHPLAGAREMSSLLFHEHGMSVPRYVLSNPSSMKESSFLAGIYCMTTSKFMRQIYSVRERPGG